MATKKKWRCRLLRHFFGLSEEYMETVYEEIFLMQYYGIFAFSEAYCLPIGLRSWYLNKLKKQFDLEAEAINSAH